MEEGDGILLRDTIDPIEFHEILKVRLMEADSHPNFHNQLGEFIIRRPVTRRADYVVFRCNKGEDLQKDILPIDFFHLKNQAISEILQHLKRSARHL